MVYIPKDIADIIHDYVNQLHISDNRIKFKKSLEIFEKQKFRVQMTNPLLWFGDFCESMMFDLGFGNVRIFHVLICTKCHNYKFYTKTDEQHCKCKHF